MAGPLVSVGNERALHIKVDTTEVTEVLAKSPMIVHFWVHGFLEKSIWEHRKAWLRAKGPKFGRKGKDGNKAITVHQVNKGPEQPAEEDVIYRMFPREQRALSPYRARLGLRDMQADAYAGSIVLGVHEEGATIRSRRRVMAIAVKTRPKSPLDWVARNPGKELRWMPSIKPGEPGVLYEVTKQRKRGRGRPRKGETMPELKEKLRLRFLLKRQVVNKPTLHFYGTWDSLVAQRDTMWSGAVQKMVEQLQKGDPRDF